MDAARAGTIDGPGAWDGYAAVAVCEAGVQALRTGEKVVVDLRRPDRQPQPGITAPDLEGARPMKLALDPQMFYATSSVYELPDIVARLRVRLDGAVAQG